MGGLVAQEFDNLGQDVEVVVRGHRQVGASGRPAGAIDQRRRNLVGRQNQIDQPGGDRAARHAVERGVFRVLGDHPATSLADRCEAQASVSACPRHHDTDRPVAAGCGQRMQQEVEGQTSAVTLIRL